MNRDHMTACAIADRAHEDVDRGERGTYAVNDSADILSHAPTLLRAS